MCNLNCDMCDLCDVYDVCELWLITYDFDDDSEESSHTTQGGYNLTAFWQGQKHNGTSWCQKSFKKKFIFLDWTTFRK